MNGPSHRNFKRKEHGHGHSHNSGPKTFPTRVLTYFIPAPANSRTTGYREKEWDKLINNLLDQGVEIIDIKMAPQSAPPCPGVWMSAVLRVKNQHINFDFDSIHPSEGHIADSDVEHDEE